jgi:hypothetical protein
MSWFQLCHALCNAMCVPFMFAHCPVANSNISKLHQAVALGQWHLQASQVALPALGCLLKLSVCCNQMTSDGSGPLVLDDLLMRVLHCCYRDTWAARLGGLAGVRLLTEKYD